MKNRSSITDSPTVTVRVVQSPTSALPTVVSPRNFFASLLTGFVLLFSSTMRAQIFEAEPNNTISQANTITSGVPITGQLLTATDVDIFAFSAGQSGLLTLEFTRARLINYGSYTISILNASGAVTASYTQVTEFTQAVSIPSAGRYYVQVAVFTPPGFTPSFYHSDKQYTLTASFALLIPTITTQPTSQTVYEGSTATLSVAATGMEPLAYQWRRNGVVVAGATLSSLRFSQAAASDAGTYVVYVSNANGTTPSNAVTLNVLPPPAPPRLINLSILTAIVANQPLAVGFVISGTTSKRVLIRAVGPTLASFGVGGAVGDPLLTLFNQQRQPIGMNDDWLPIDATIMAASGAFALPALSRDAAYVATLQPGSYTVQVSGYQNSTGAVLVEVYETP